MRKGLCLALLSTVVLVGCGGDSDETATTPGATSTTMADDHQHGEGGAACEPSGTTVSVVASETRFNSDCYAAPANQPFTISYENKDTIGHNIAILETHTSSETFYRAEIFKGPKTVALSVAPLAAGNYAFHCEVHPTTMAGTFVVK